MSNFLKKLYKPIKNTNLGSNTTIMDFPIRKNYSKRIKYQKKIIFKS